MRPVRETDKLLAANLLAVDKLFKNYNPDTRRRNARFVAAELSRHKRPPTHAAVDSPQEGAAQFRSATAKVFLQADTAADSSSSVSTSTK